MATTATIEKSDTAKQVLCKVKVEGPQTCVVCEIPFSCAEEIIQREAKQKSVSAKGYRVGKGPTRLVYQADPKLFNWHFVNEIKTNKPNKLEQQLKNCLTPPDYKAMPWDGSSAFKVEVRFYHTPASPVAGGKFANIANTQDGDSMGGPTPGSFSLQSFLPDQVKALGTQGIGLGQNLSAGMGNHPGAGGIGGGQGNAGQTPSPTPDTPNTEVKLPQPVGNAEQRGKPSVATPEAQIPKSEPTMPDKEIPAASGGDSKAGGSSNQAKETLKQVRDIKQPRES